MFPRLPSLLFAGLALLALSLACGGSSSEKSSPSAASGPTGTPGPCSTEDDAKSYVVLLSLSQFVQPRTVHKWMQPVRILVTGDVRPADRTTLDAVIGELRTLSGVDIALVAAAGQENLTINFVPRADFPRYLARTIAQLPPEARFGYEFSLEGAPVRDSIARAVIAIDTAGSPLDDRTKGIYFRRLLAGAFGLSGRTDLCPGSLFATNVTNMQSPAFTNLDRRAIQLVYSDAVRVGMDEAQLRSALGR